MTLEFGGHCSIHDDNLLNSNSFEFLLEAPRSEYFGEEMYPDIFQKAAVYCYFIIKDHVFHDGNKRTGIGVTIWLLEANNYRAQPSLTKDVLIDLALSIANSELEIPDIADILKQHFKQA
ncbi:MAG: type II toxin-antitoxin system death-on-curing family toxin [Calditrichaeota bacterium]|nr:type II toxin-antitoxin system death-on-curing family toxin [Calditrichota bacterium]